MSRFLAVGECMVEFAVCPDGRYKMGFAGDTFNTAWYVREVAPPGLDVAYLTAVGDDRPSMQMLRFMEDAGIQPEARIRKNRTVGLYVISLISGERSFSYWRSDSAARTLADDLTGLPGAAPEDMVYFSGITLAILPDSGRVRLLDVLSSCRDSGISVAFDPNIRLKLWSNAEEIRRWVTEGARVSDIVLPSFDDESALFGDRSPHATSERYLDEGAKTVAVKDGPNSVLVRTPEDRCIVANEPIDEPADTTAAGDSFNAGFLARAMQGADWNEAASFGCDVARTVISSHGALVPLGNRAQV